jgi:hypothetical protein
MPLTISLRTCSTMPTAWQHPQRSGPLWLLFSVLSHFRRSTLTLAGHKGCAASDSPKAAALILPEVDKWLTKWLLEEFRGKGKSENSRVFTGLMVGLGGLEPPTSPLSG